MIGKIDLWGIIKEHEQTNSIEFTPIQKNHILEIVHKAFKYQEQESNKSKPCIPPMPDLNGVCFKCGKRHTLN